MYRKKVSHSEDFSVEISVGLRSITRDFIFVSQDDKTRFAAEPCIDVLRAADMLIGEELYLWSNHIHNEQKFYPSVCNANHTPVLASGIFEPWLAPINQLSQIRSHMRTAARGTSLVRLYSFRSARAF